MTAILSALYYTLCFLWMDKGGFLLILEAVQWTPHFRNLFLWLPAEAECSKKLAQVYHFWFQLTWPPVRDTSRTLLFWIHVVISCVSCSVWLYTPFAFYLQFSVFFPPLLLISFPSSCLIFYCVCTLNGFGSTSKQKFVTVTVYMAVEHTV